MSLWMQIAGASIDQDLGNDDYLDNDDYLNLTMIIYGCWFGALIKRLYVEVLTFR